MSDRRSAAESGEQLSNSQTARHRAQLESLNRVRAQLEAIEAHVVALEQRREQQNNGSDDRSDVLYAQDANGV